MQESNTCPLEWTRLGCLWSDLEHAESQAIHDAYQLALLYGLAFFAFNKNGYAKTMNGEVFFPLSVILKKIHSKGKITLQEFKKVVDSKSHLANYSYWETDLKNSGVIVQNGESLIINDKYRTLANDIRRFSFNDLSSEKLLDFRNNQLSDQNPFVNQIRKLLNGIERQNIMAQENQWMPLEQAFVETFDLNRLVGHKYNLNGNERVRLFSQVQRNIAWAQIVKNRYKNKCSLPSCDAEGNIFTEAAHIKAHSAPGQHHRIHVLNGICLCRHCHSAFDRGLFSFKDHARVIVSPKLQSVPSQHAKKVIQLSENQTIRRTIDPRHPIPCPEFMKYHHLNVFQK